MQTSLARGFTLLEMVVSIILLGIVATTIGAFILPAVTAQQDVERRAALVDATESALRRMSRDIRLALPNSVRISNSITGGVGFAIEMIPALDGGKYCDSGVANCAGASQLLDITVSDTDFDVVGCFRNSTFTGASFPSTAFRLVIGDSSGLVYSASGSPAVVTPSGTSITLSTVNGGGAGSGTCGTSSGTNTSYRHHLAISGGHRFSTASSRQRVFVVQTSALPVTYICNATTGTLTRYAGYSIQSSQPTDASAAPLSTASSIGRVAGNISSSGCGITSDTPSVQSRSVVTLSIGLTSSGESVQLMSQVQLDNSQ
ncbi:MAG TPA: type II secretion system protein [Burkholderiales bacterium]